MSRGSLALLALAACAAVAVGFAFFDNQQTLSANAEAAARYTPQPIATVPKKDLVNVTAIGDSFTAGSAMGGKEAANWTSLVSRSLSTEARVVKFASAGLGGSGYVTVGPTKKTFLDATRGTVLNADTDLVIFFGSINDIEQDPHAIGKAAADSYAAARKASPNAELMVIGPAWPHVNRVKDIAERRDVLKAAADTAGATFVDPLDAGWFRGADRALIGSDGTHPTDEGHVYMAERIAPAVSGVLGF